MNQELQRINGGQIQTVGFGEVEQRPYAETSSQALAAREQATIQARIITALQRPRNVERFRTRLLAECKRPGFAEAAEYSRPVGKEKDKATGQWVEKFATGPTIRLIETAIQFYGNIVMESQIIFETDEARIVRCMSWDLETNAIWDTQVALPKRVEKRGFKGRDGKVEPPKGRTVIGQRVNSEGDVTFLVLATDDEMRIVQSALTSKTQRKNAERLLPADIIAEALDECRKTIAAGIEADPKAAIRKIIDGFTQFNVEVTDLEAWCGKTIDKISPKEIAQLRSLWQGLRDGEVTWDEAMAAKDPAGTAEAAKEVGERKLLNLKQGQQSKAEESKPVSKYVTGEQIDKLRQALAASDITEAEFLTGLQNVAGCDTIETIPADKFEKVLGCLQPAPDMTEEEMRRQQEQADAKPETTKKRGGLKL